MTAEEGSFAGARGRVHTRTWRPDRSPRSAVVIVHGLAEHGGRYEGLGSALAGAGHLATVADLAGHGRSKGRPVDGPSLDDHVADTLTAIWRARKEAPAGRLFVVGHSLGGLVALLLAVRHPEHLDGLVLSGPVAAVPARVSPLTIFAGRVLARVAPRTGVTAVDLTAISRDPAVVEAYLSDPLIPGVGRIPARLGVQMYDAVREVRRRAGELTVPMLVMHGSADSIADPAGSRHLHEHAGSTDRTLRIYEGLYHEIFNEPERDLVIADLLAWLSAHA